MVQVNTDITQTKNNHSYIIVFTHSFMSNTDMSTNDVFFFFFNNNINSYRLLFSDTRT